MKPVIFQGKTYNFPDDATPEEIKTFLGGDKPAEPKKPEAPKTEAPKDDAPAKQPQSIGEFWDFARNLQIPKSPISDLDDKVRTAATVGAAGLAPTGAAMANPAATGRAIEAGAQGAKSVATNPHVTDFAKWLAKMLAGGALAGLGFKHGSGH